MTVAGCGAHVYHVVQKGETLYSISFHHGRDYQQVAQWNDIDPPYTLHTGQRIRISPPSGERSGPSEERSGPRVPQERGTTGDGQAAPRTRQAVVWQWPVRNARAQPLIKVSSGRRGIDITGELRAPVRAAADGRVVYSGTGIPHYGRLLIIKHDARFLSAYAHNERLLVREGQQVVAGQQIAEMGQSGTGTDTVKLHFEIRLDGRPVDPLRYLSGE